MRPAATGPVLDEVVHRLVETYHPDRIYLFGSAARGDSGPDSDYDLMVVVPDDASPELLRGRAGHLALAGLGVATDIGVLTANGFDRQLHLKASLPSTIIREGKVLYAARPGSR